MSDDEFVLLPIRPTREMLDLMIESGGQGMDYHTALGMFFAGYLDMAQAMKAKELNGE